MAVATTEELILAALAPTATAARSSRTSAPGRRVQSLVADIDRPDEPLCAAVTIAETVERLRAAGLLQHRSDGDTGESIVLPTAAGATRACTVRELLATTEIEVLDGAEPRKTSLSALATELEKPLVAVAAACTADGQYDPTQSRPTPPILDRETQRQRLQAAYDRVRETGVGEAVFVTGPPGVGKTTFVEDVLNRLDDVTVAYGSCSGGGGEPYQPLRDALAHRSSEMDPFEDPAPPVAEKPDFDALRRARFHALTSALTMGAGPHVLVLDDLDVADRGTLAYLEYLLDRLPESQLLVIGSLRSDTPPTKLTRLVTKSGASRLPLPALTAAETDTLVDDLTGTGDRADVGEAVTELRADTPLQVRAIIDLLFMDHVRGPEHGDRSGVPTLPDDPDERLRLWLGTVEMGSYELLKWLAVADGALPVSVLETVSSLSRVRIATTLDILAAVELLQRSPDGERVWLRSRVLGDTLRDGLDESERTRLHRHLARALKPPEDDEAEPWDDASPFRPATPVDVGGGHPSAVGTHSDRAGLHDDAVEWYRTAADCAKLVPAHDVAATYLERAATVADRADETKTRLEILESLATTYITIGEFEQAQRTIRNGQLAVDAGDTAGRQRVGRLSAELALCRDGPDAAIEAVEECLDIADDNPVETCRLLLVRAKAELERDEPDTALETATTVCDRAKRLEQPALHARATLLCGDTARAAGADERAAAYYKDAMTAYEGVDDRWELTKTRARYGSLAADRNDLETARKYLEIALETLDRYGDHRRLGRVHHRLGAVHEALGDSDLARMHFESAAWAFDTIESTDCAAEAARAAMALDAEAPSSRTSVDENRGEERPKKGLDSDRRSGEPEHATAEAGSNPSRHSESGTDGGSEIEETTDTVSSSADESNPPE